MGTSTGAVLGTGGLGSTGGTEPDAETEPPTSGGLASSGSSGTTGTGTTTGEGTPPDVEVEPPAPPPPINLLLVVADDQGWGDVGWNDPELRTPNLDALAASGVRLDQHYVHPQCTPTRAALLTGRYPSRFGPHANYAGNEMTFPAGTDTLASILRDAGWATGMSGKWHLGSDPNWGPLNHGFDYAHGSLAGGVGMYDHRYKLGSPYEETWHRNHTPLFQEGHVTDLVMEEAIGWIEGHANEPWFFYVPFHATHNPLVEFDPIWAEMNDHIDNLDRRLFGAALSHMDDAVGELASALARTGQAERTIVVFLSDNGGRHTDYNGSNFPPPDPVLQAGYSSNAPFKGGKATVWEGGIRVPAFVHWPATLPQRVHTRPMHAVDWLPTLTSWLGVDVPVGLALDGQDVSSLLHGVDLEPPDRSFYWVWGPAREYEALRHDDWKILRGSGDWHLYDLLVDPHEVDDLAAALPAKVAELETLFEAHREKDIL